MMFGNRKKFKISTLKISSFITSTRELRGGAALTFQADCPYFKTQPKTCVESVDWCWTP
ncbi:hypothetical protein C900_02242 [Fulvivirga imtechensis AK7]|uniref:Uncharacterized protein n=1 Tax=Fulvivirga imtechensis AK7 TaxID=1237149 RepID=L8JXC0_9BACT|nr:hypothetical protein C900_02242 [Fulvivirga imtechensis AK7]